MTNWKVNMKKVIALSFALLFWFAFGAFNIGFAADLKPVRQYLSIVDEPVHRPAVLLMEGKSCKDCATVKSILEKLADKRKDYDFYIDPKRITDEGYIFVRFSADVVTISILKPDRFDAIDKLNAVLDERLAYFKRVAPVKAKIDAIAKKLDELRQPFDQKLVDLRSYSSDAEELHRLSFEIEEQWKLASAPFEKRLKLLDAQYQVLRLRNRISDQH
jgi:hypothetical protein